MFKLFCVTNRSLCRGDFLVQIERIAQSSVSGVILREKDLPPDQYEELAKSVMQICARYQTDCILHRFAGVAEQMGAPAIQVSLPDFLNMSEKQKAAFNCIGVSCHSLEDAQLAERLGASSITLGHIFATDCKKGLPPRGLGLLKQVCKKTHLPVYAIGGIGEDNIAAVQQAGAAGACVMSGLMQAARPDQLVQSLKRAGETK